MGKEGQPCALNETDTARLKRVLDNKDKREAKQHPQHGASTFDSRRRNEDMPFDAPSHVTPRKKELTVEIPTDRSGNSGVSIGRIKRIFSSIMSSPSSSQQSKVDLDPEQGSIRDGTKDGLSDKEQQPNAGISSGDGPSSSTRRRRAAELCSAEDYAELRYQHISLKRQHKQTVATLLEDKRRKESEVRNLWETVNNLISELDKSNVTLKTKEQDHDRDSARLRQILRARTDQLEKVKGEKEDLTRNLERCKDRIFSMQPVQGMTDTQLRDKYTDLCNSIEDWVESHFDDMENFLLNLATHGIKQPRETANVVEAHIEDEDIGVIKGEPATELMMLQALIARHLYVTLLTPGRVYPGLGSDTDFWFSEILDGMRFLTPPKGKSFLAYLSLLLMKSRQRGHPDVAS